MQTRPPLLDSLGRPVQLGQQLGSGGEGTVFEIRDRSDLVVKLYHRSCEPEKAAKIAQMAKAANERLLKLTAWPTEPIRLGSGGGAVIGFTMPKITGHKQAFNLYSPKLRLQEFPKATWQFLIRSAANAARAFAAIHETGHVIGDVNHGNLFVGDRATVRLIDCDSYQITINGSRWFCEVGTPTHQPPELQNVHSYKGIVRTPNHDNFGLAVIIFQMLFMARHPFSGRFLGTGQMPMERAISEYRFAYGSNAAAMQMQPPPSSLGLNGVTRDMALLFERAFSWQGSQPSGRPTAREWVTALQDLEAHLKKCSVISTHQFVDTLAKCPWCDIEAATGVPLFTVALVGSAHTGFTIADFWGKVTSVPKPGLPPALPRVDDCNVSPSPAALELRQASWGSRFASGLFALVGGNSRIDTLKKEIDKRVTDARSRWQNIQNNWTSYTSANEFDDLLSQLQSLRTQYDALPQKRLQALQQLETNKYRLQLQAHLYNCRIFHARIKGVGDTRKATLQSYGIETAADIVDGRVLAVPGFGPVALSNLKNWRNQQERRFRFDPNKGVDQAAKNAVERQILTQKIDLERKLNEALSKLTVSSHHILTRRRTVFTQAEQAALDLAQAEADLRASLAPVIMPMKWALVALATASIGTLMIAAHGTRGPSSLPSQGAQPSIASPLPPPSRPILPLHVEFGPNGQWQPEDGYNWSNAGHTTVRWAPGKVSGRNAHVIASDTEGDWEPEDGYAWVNPNNPRDKSVKWEPGIASKKHQNVVAGLLEGQWQPVDGYGWPINPPRLGDMRVKPIPAPVTQNPNLVPANPFQRGLADRWELERWVAGLSGEFRRGVEWWAARRSIPNPGSCGEVPGLSPDFIAGCEAAKARLTPTDRSRRSDPEYRRGWNSYSPSISPQTVPDGRGVSPSPITGQGASANPATTGSDLTRRLNEQELIRLRGR